MFDVRGANDFNTLAPLMNNLVWFDPYGSGSIVGDIADGWSISSDGTVITFNLRKGIAFHDGTPLTSRDVAYAFDRGWKPRSTTGTTFKDRFRPIQRIETPDDSTVKITLSTPSNSFFASTTMNNFAIYPSHIPLPEKLDSWKQNPVGSGPFKMKEFKANVSMEYVANERYFKRGLPYVESITYTQISDRSTGLAAIRVGRIDANNFDNTEVITGRAELQRAGFVLIPIVSSMLFIRLNNAPPWTEPRVREAVDLALDRQVIIDVAWFSLGTPNAAYLIPPEMGGLWGIPSQVMKSRPGFRPDKKADLERAKALLAEARVDPAQTTVRILGRTDLPEYAVAAERSFAALGFKTNVAILAQAPRQDAELRGNYDIEPVTSPFSIDDPADYLTPWVITGGSVNFAKWSDPILDQLLGEQDKTVDANKRKQLLLQVQERSLANRHTLAAGIRTNLTGHWPYVKNYPTFVPFNFSPRFRWEQVWLER